MVTVCLGKTKMALTLSVFTGFVLKSDEVVVS